jgi:hypothetical protein
MTGFSISARRLAALGGSQHFSKSFRSLPTSVEPDCRWSGSSCEAGQGQKRQKLKC